MTRTIPFYADSVDKLVHQIALLAKETVYFNGKPVMQEKQEPGKSYLYQVKPPEKVVVSPSLLRKFSCTAGCTACCLPFTLDFTNDEFNSFRWKEEVEAEAIERFSTRYVEVNGTKYPVQTYEQFRDDACPFLRPTRTTEDGEVALGCGFWTEDNSTQPLSCASAPQLLVTTRGIGTTAVMKRPFGRGWKWKNKPQCEFDPLVDRISKIPDTFDLTDEIRLLERFEEWSRYLGLTTWIPDVIEVLQDFPSLLRKSNLQSVVVHDAR